MFKRKVSNQEISQYVTDLASLQEQRREALSLGKVDEMEMYDSLIEHAMLVLERLYERAG